MSHRPEFISFVQRTQQVMAKRGANSGIAIMVPEQIDDTSGTCNLLTYEIVPSHKMMMIMELTASLHNDCPQHSQIQELKAVVEKLFGPVSTSNVTAGLN